MCLSVVSAGIFPPNESVGLNGISLSIRLICMVTDWEDHMGRGVGQDEDELLEDLCCPIHRKPCEARKEDNYFFALSNYQQPLEELLSSNPDFVRPSFRMNEVCIVTEAPQSVDPELASRIFLDYCKLHLIIFHDCASLFQCISGKLFLTL